MRLFITPLIVFIGIIGTLFLLRTLNISLPITVTTKTTSGELSVVGEGKVEAAPDTAYVDAGIQVNDATTVEAAQATINTANNAIIDAMKALDIEKADIKTSNYSVYPMYEGVERKARGYSANVTVSIKVRDTKKVSDVLTRAIDAGANTIQGVRFAIDDPAKLREQAREAAIANAKEQAKKLAGNLGIKLGRITNIVESSGGMPPIAFAESAMLKDGRGGGTAPVVEPGSQTISSQVTLFFEKL